MTKKLQEIFDRITESKREQKELKRMYKDALANSNEYQRLMEDIKELRADKKKIEDKIKAEFSSEFDKMDTLKLDIENDMMLLSDVALTQMMSGKTVEIRDKYENKYEPVFKVNFKKA